MRFHVPASALALLVGSLGLAAQQPVRLSRPAVSPAVWGLLALPPAPGPHLGVVLLPGSGGWNLRYPRLAALFADSGFAVLAVDYYGETGIDTYRADALLKRPVWLATIRNAVAYLRDSASAGKPVALVGFSRGAYLAVSAATRTPGVGAVVDFFGGGPAHPDSLRAQARGFPPLLILHGDADSTVSVSEAYRLRDAVQAQGGQVEVHIYPGANHGFFNSEESSMDAIRQAIAFLHRLEAALPSTGSKP